MSSLPHSVRAVFTPGIFWSPNWGEGSICTNLCALNKYLRKNKFRMLTHASLTEQLVHFCRSERCVFPHPNQSSPQKISEVRFPGDLLGVPRALFRSVFKPKGVCAVHGSGNSAAETAGHPLGHISG